jgi:RNA polymerase sigma-70 factor (ECF subfamily)
MGDDVEDPVKPMAADVLATLVANHRDFLAFVQRRVGSRELAEDIVQAAFVKNAEKMDTIRESAVGWFYTVLRNAITDHFRRTASTARAQERLAAESSEEATDEELHATVCRCVNELATTLKPEYAEALRAIEIDGQSVKDYADKLGISANNAGVRVFRAREALKRQVMRSCGTCADHGCLDCTCGAPAQGHGHGH